MVSVYNPAVGSAIDARRPVDPKRCKASVTQDWRTNQCQRKVVSDGWCKQHHPATEAERGKNARERYEASSRKWAMGNYGERMMAALIKIRDGDNNPRETAAIALEGVSYASSKVGE